MPDNGKRNRDIAIMALLMVVIALGIYIILLRHELSHLVCFQS